MIGWLLLGMATGYAARALWMRHRPERVRFALGPFEYRRVGEVSALEFGPFTRLRVGNDVEWHSGPKS